MNANYGFTVTLTAKSGKGDQLVELLLTGLADGQPGSNDACLVYLVSRSGTNPDQVQVAETWTTEAAHHTVFAGDAAQALFAAAGDLLEGEPIHYDFAAVGGKAF